MTDTIIKLGGAWHYRLDKLIARSTFGEVWQATWLQTGSQVAIKTINHTRMAAASPSLRPLWPESLHREIQLMRDTGHRNLVRKLQHGEVDGLPVLVLEQLHHSLADELKICGPSLPLKEALHIVRQVADGLAWLHRHDICHLDLKPQNILLTPPGPLQRIKLADFGMSLKLVDGVGEHRIPGSLGWLAPEQVFPARIGTDGQPVYRSDTRTDVYGLGLLLFYLLTGESTEFSATAAALLRAGPEAAMRERSRLELLALTGLTERDMACLKKTQIIPPPLSPQVLKESSEATWLPLNTGREGQTQTPRPPLNASGKAIFPLLRRLLAVAPDQRPADASVLRELISGCSGTIALP